MSIINNIVEAESGIKNYLIEDGGASLVNFVVPMSTGKNITFSHAQATPSQVWIINHNAGTYPKSVRLLATDRSEMIADVSDITINQTQVFFNTPAAGYAEITFLRGT